MPDPVADTVVMTKAQAEQYMRGMALLQKLDGDPRTKPLLEDAVKIHFPEVTTERETLERQVTPLLKPFQETLEKVNQRFEAEDAAKAAAAEKATEAKLASAFQTLAGQGYTEEGIGKIKQLMVDNGIADAFAAAALFDKQNPPAALESSYQPQTWDLGAGHAPAQSMEALFKDPDSWADKQVGIVLNEERAKRAA